MQRIIRLSKTRYVEFNRSLSLFLIIFRFLTFLAILFLVMLSSDVINELLQVTDEEVPFLHQLPFAVSLMLSGGFLQLSIICLCGIYGFATLNRSMLFYYASFLILLTLYLIINFIIEEDLTDYGREKLFMNFKENKQGLSLMIDMIQQTYKCCGTKHYRFEDLPHLPDSCCPGYIRRCPEEKAFPKLCETNRSTLTNVIEYSNKGIFSEIVALVLAITMLIELFLTCHMIHILTAPKHFLHERRSSVYLE